MALFKSSDGTQTYSTVKTPTYKYKKGNQFRTFYSKTPGAIPTEANIAAMAKKSEASYKVYEDKFGKALLDRIALKMHGKKFRELDKESTLKNFKAKLDKYEDFIIENKRYPTQAEAFQIGMQKAGNKKFGLGKSGITGNIKTFVDDTYSKGIGGSTYIAKELAKPPYNYKIDDSVIRRYITEEVEAGRLKRPKNFETQKADPNLPKDRYFKVRPVTERDKKGFTVGKTGTEVKAPTWAKFKVTYKSPKNPDNSLIPEKYFGTQYYKTKESAEKALEARRKLDLSKTDEAVRVVNKLIKADPDLASDIRALAQEVYGTAEGATALAKEQDLERKMRSVATDVTRLQEQLSGKIQGFSESIKKIKGLILPTGKLAEDILTDITVNTDIGRFGGTAIRNSRMRIISGILNERKGKFNSLRNAVTKFVASGRHLDEVAGIGATYDVAPGYASFTQTLPEKINLEKGKKIDLDFARLLRQAVTEQTGPKTYRGVKYDTLGEAINAYNKFSKDFAKQNKLFTPTIEYSPGKKLDPSKFAPNYATLRPEAKANVLELAKKGIGINVGAAKTFEQIILADAKKGGKVCNLFFKDGGRAGFAKGGTGCVEVVEEALTRDPKKLAQDVNKLNEGGAFNKVKNSATKFLTAIKENPNILKGRFGALAALGVGTIAAGAGAGALVKQFRSDDPSTYLTNEGQMEGMLIEDVNQLGEGVEDNIFLDNQFKLELAGAAGLTAPIAGQVYRTARQGTPPLLESPLEFDKELKDLKRTIRQITHPDGKKAKKISEAGQQVIRSSKIRINEIQDIIQSAKAGKEGSGVFRSALGLEKGVLGKGLWALGAPIVQVPSTIGYIAQDVREGKDVGEIATNPLNYLGAAFMNPSVKALARAGASRGLLGIASLGLAGTAVGAVALPAISIGAGLATLGTLGYQGYKLFTGKDRSDEDFFK
jgi:hypothetical protein